MQKMSQAGDDSIFRSQRMWTVPEAAEGANPSPVDGMTTLAPSPIVRWCQGRVSRRWSEEQR